MVDWKWFGFVACIRNIFKSFTPDILDQRLVRETKNGFSTTENKTSNANSEPFIAGLISSAVMSATNVFSGCIHVVLIITFLNTILVNVYLSCSIFKCRFFLIKQIILQNRKSNALFLQSINNGSFQSSYNN